mgnify:CR=1 FL=1
MSDTESVIERRMFADDTIKTKKETIYRDDTALKSMAWDDNLRPTSGEMFMNFNPTASVAMDLDNFKKFDQIMKNRS